MTFPQVENEAFMELCLKFWEAHTELCMYMNNYNGYVVNYLEDTRHTPHPWMLNFIHTQIHIQIRLQLVTV